LDLIISEHHLDLVLGLRLFSIIKMCQMIDIVIVIVIAKTLLVLLALGDKLKLKENSQIKTKTWSQLLYC